MLALWSRRLKPATRAQSRFVDAVNDQLPAKTWSQALFRRYLELSGLHTFKCPCDYTNKVNGSKGLPTPSEMRAASDKDFSESDAFPTNAEWEDMLRENEEGIEDWDCDNALEESDADEGSPYGIDNLISDDETAEDRDEVNEDMFEVNDAVDEGDNEEPGDFVDDIGPEPRSTSLYNDELE